jgi:hypothetical protein
MGHWGADARPGDVSLPPVKPTPAQRPAQIPIFSPAHRSATLLFSGPLAPRRGRLNDVGPRADDELRAAPVPAQAQDLRSALWATGCMAATANGCV